MSNKDGRVLLLYFKIMRITLYIILYITIIIYITITRITIIILCTRHS